MPYIGIVKFTMRVGRKHSPIIYMGYMVWCGPCVASDAGEGGRGEKRERQRSWQRVVRGRHTSSFEAGKEPGLQLGSVRVGSKCMLRAIAAVIPRVAWL